MSVYSISATIIGDATISGNATIPKIVGLTNFDTTPTAPTCASSTNSTVIATTAYVKAQGYSTTDSVNPSWTGTGTFGIGLITGNATIPNIIGLTAFDTTPTAPTPVASTNSTAIATTAYVKSQNYSTADSLNPSWTGTGTFGIGLITGNATINGNAIITGNATIPKIVGLTNFDTTPTAPTPITSTNSTVIATTAYVKAQGYSTTDTVNPSWTGSGTFGVGLTTGRATINGTVTIAGTATIPTIIGLTTFDTTPTAPTPIASTNSTVIATTAYVKAQGYSTTDSANPIWGGSGKFEGGITLNGSCKRSDQLTQAYIRGDNSQMTDNYSQANGVWIAGLYGVRSANAAQTINGYWALYAPTASILAGGIALMSDIRLKNNIKDIEGNDCLLVLRKLTPKIYNYIDYKKNNNRPKMGFIAQDIELIFPFCINTVTDFLPDIFEKCHVINGDTIILENKSTKLFNIDTQIKIKYFDESNNSFITTISSIIDNKSFMVSDKIPETFIFVYGQEVSDLKNIDYDSIFSFMTGAVKTIDEIVQEQQIQIEILKKNNSVLEKRLTLLEERFFD